MSKQINSDDIFDAFQSLAKDNVELLPVQFKSRVTGAQYEPLYNLIHKYVAENSRVLDWGCGNGHFSYFAVKCGFQTHAYSFANEALIRFLEENFSSSFEYSTARDADPVNLPFTAESYNVVTSVGVLEHVRETGGDERASMKEINRVLIPGGLFICGHFPNKYSYIEKINSKIPSQHHHVYKYIRADIEEFCNDTGFEILETGRYGFIPRNCWNRLPVRMSQSNTVSATVRYFDTIFKYLFPRYCQNHYFVAQKK